MTHVWDPICPRPRRLVRPVRRDPQGLTGPTPGQARGPHWRQCCHGWHVPSDVSDALPEQRVLEQSVRAGDSGAVTGWASLRLHGAGFFDGRDRDGITRIPVPLVVGREGRVRPDERVQVSREPLPPGEVSVRQGIRSTSPARALFDEMRRIRDVREAAVAMDMAAAALLVSVRQMRECRQQHHSWRRSALVASALDLASERTRSPQESRLRLVWQLDAGLPRPGVNQPVWVREGRLLGIADLLDEEAGLVGEFDGADHRTAARHTADLERQERLERCGLVVVRVTGLDLRAPRRIVERLHFHRSRALFLPSPARAWTTAPPPGVGREQTLDEYLDEQRVLRQMHHGVS